MIRIICTECKNAYLQNKGGKFVCPSCEATFEESCENLLLGVQYYNEGNYGEADNCLMKYIVKNGAEPLAVIYKALCDAKNFDEDTDSLEDTYKKIIDAFSDVPHEDFPKLIAISNDLIQETEKALSESHVRLFADADAEKIKKEVAAILNIQDKATAFRSNLSDLVAKYNESSSQQISVKFSDCFYVEKEIAEEVGDIKFQKICENIASHTVFTGILTNDIKNLEIYYRCIVMFFQKSHDKYEFLLSQAEKFNQLEELLEQGQYNTIKGTGAIADKLKSVSYEFLQESYKEHFDEHIATQEETVVFIEPEIVPEPVTEEAPEEIAENTSDENENAPEIQEETEDVVGESEPANEDTHPDSEIIDEVDSVEETSPEEEQETETQEISESVTEDTPEEEQEDDLADDVIEIEVQDTSTDEEKIEPENISSTSVDEEVNDVETEEETGSEDSSNGTDETDESDGIVEIESEPKYDIVECDIAVNDTDKDDISNEPVPEENGTDKKPKKKKSRKGLVLVVLLIALAGLVSGYKFGPQLVNDYKYDKAVSLAEGKKYDDAITVFAELGDYSDSKDKLTECEYNRAVLLEEAENFSEAKIIFEKLDNYGDSKTRAQACAYSEANMALESEDFDTAAKLFTELGEYGDSETMVKECSYRKALSLMENKEYETAIEILTAIKKYSDSKDKITEAKYMYVTDNFVKTNKTTVKYLDELTSADYRNSAELRKELLGSSEVTSSDVKVFVNYSSSDLKTALTKLDNTKVIYFHTVVNDKSLYGQTLTLKYTTAYGYSQKQTVTLSESNNTAVMSYPSTQYTNYTVVFELLDSNGKTVAQQKISF